MLIKGLFSHLLVLLPTRALQSLPIHPIKFCKNFFYQSKCVLEKSWGRPNLPGSQNLIVGTSAINLPGALSQETVPGCSSEFIAPSCLHSQGRLGTRGHAPPLLASVSQLGAGELQWPAFLALPISWETRLWAGGSSTLSSGTRCVLLLDTCSYAGVP